MPPSMFQLYFKDLQLNNDAYNQKIELNDVYNQLIDLQKENDELKNANNELKKENDELKFKMKYVTLAKNEIYKNYINCILNIKKK